MRLIWLALVVAVASGSGAAAQQAQTQSALPTGQPYRHGHSGLVVPPVLDGLPRQKVTAWAADQLDEAVDFATTDQGEVLTVFVFRNVSGSVPVWFDRIRYQVEHRDIYGGVDPIALDPAFAPPGQQSPSGLMMAYATRKGPFRSTAIALMPLGSWYVSIRYSSKTLDPAPLATHLRSVIGALHWPDNAAQAPAAKLIDACDRMLKLDGTAKTLAPDTGQMLLGALVASGIDKKPGAHDKPVPPPVWCKDATQFDGAAARSAVYRANGATDSYIIAVNDAGRAVSVFPDTLSALLGDKQPRWAAELVDMARTLNFAPYDRLPPPSQAFTLLQGARPISTSSTWGTKKSLTLTAPDKN